MCSMQKFGNGSSAPCSRAGCATAPRTRTQQGRPTVGVGSPQSTSWRVPAIASSPLRSPPRRSPPPAPNTSFHVLDRTYSHHARTEWPGRLRQGFHRWRRLRRRLQDRRRPHRTCQAAAPGPAHLQANRCRPAVQRCVYRAIIMST